MRLEISINLLWQTLGRRWFSYSEIFEFLKSNGLNTCAIPTIDDLGTYKLAITCQKISAVMASRPFEKICTLGNEKSRENPWAKRVSPQSSSWWEWPRSDMGFLDEIMNCELNLVKPKSRKTWCKAKENEEMYAQRFREIRLVLKILKDNMPMKYEPLAQEWIRKNCT